MDAQTQFSRHPVGGNTRSGITLVESVVAIFLFGLFIAGACQLVIVTKQTADRARLRYAAVNLAKNRIERLNTFRFDELEMANENKKVMNAQGGLDDTADFEVTTEVSPISANLKEVKVTVAIRDRMSRTFNKERQELVTYRTDLSEHMSEFY